MKKNLLIMLAVALTFSVTAQRRMLNPAKRAEAPQRESELNEPVQTHSSVFPKAQMNQRRIRSRSGHGMSATGAPAITIALGSASNALGPSGPSKSNLWYDQDINSVVFTHRSNMFAFPDLTTGYYRYDISTDGGNTWADDQGPIYSNPNNFERARYPLGVIYNPSPNTNPNNAYVTYAGPWNAGSTWLGRVYGVSKLDLSHTVQHYDSTSYTAFPRNMFVVKNTGDLWILCNMYTTGTANTWLDSLVLTHGVWNSTTNDFDYTNLSIPAPVNPDLGFVVDVDVAFNDVGTIGYIAMLTNNDVGNVVYPDSILYLSVLKTTDGGATWNYSNNCTVHPDIIDVSTVLDPVLANDSSLYGTTFDLDVVVDANSNLHVLTGISPSNAFAVVGDNGPGRWGMFDIYTTDQGLSWKAQLLGKPVTFRGTFGDGSTANTTLNEDNHQFASRSWDGTKLFFSWFDTDTIAYGTDPNTPQHNNRFPDMISVGYDVNSGMWTDTLNLTRGGDADGACTFGSGSYYVIDSAGLGTVFSIPAVYQQLADPIQTGSPTSYWYIHNANVSMSLATHPGSPITLPCIVQSVSTPVRSNGFSVSANYPNPFNGKTSVDINLVKASDVTVEVSNLLGEVISMSNYSNLTSGSHTLTIDGNKLSAGMYVYKVKAGNDVATAKMTIE